MIAASLRRAVRTILTRDAAFASGGVFVVGVGVLSHLRAYATPDMGFLLEEAARVIGGARPYVDLADVNTPLTILLNIGAVLAARATGLSPILAYRLGCTALMLATLVLAGWWLRRMLPGEVMLRRGLLFALCFVLFILAAHDFGEREHLVLALTVPYLLLSAGRAEGTGAPLGFAALSGVLLGCAIALKPHFVLVWLGVETYVRLTGHARWRSVLPETVAAAAFLSTFSLAMAGWLPGYLDLLLLLGGTYAKFLHEPFWNLMVTGRGAPLVFFAVFALLSVQNGTKHRALHQTLGTAAVVALIAGAAQQKGFSYHFYPALALAMLVLSLVACDGASQQASGVRRTYRVLAMGLCVTIFGTGMVRSAVTAVRPVLGPEQQHTEQLLPIVRQRASGEAVYVMSYDISSAYPLMNYAGTRSASRFPQLWLVPALYLEQLQGSGPLQYRRNAEMGPTERFLMRAVFEDLHKHQPRLLVVLQPGPDLPANGFRRIDYLAFFGRDPRIAELLRSYQLVTEVGAYSLYERVAPGALRTGHVPGALREPREVAQGPNIGSVPAPIRDPAFRLTAAVFLVSTLFAGLLEWGRGAAQSQSQRVG